MQEEKSAAPIAWRRLVPWFWRGTFAVALLFAVAYVALPLWVDRIAGSSDWSALEGESLSPAAEGMVDRHLRDLSGQTLIDVHAHLAGRGADSPCWVHPSMLSRLHPKSWVRFQSYLSAGRVGSDDPDSVFADGLFALAKALPLETRTHVLGFDFARDAAGAEDRDGSFFQVPDEWVYSQVARGGAQFVPAPSIHPRDPKALERLRAAAQAGARLIKWLPAAHNIDPGDAANDEFYALVRELNLTLLVHCGDEHAVVTPHGFELGNPLRLRRPLDQGTRILVAHCATSGMGQDLDDPTKPDQPNHVLFLRLMDEAAYRSVLFGGLSTVTQVNHFKEGLADLLARPDLHPRLVNGSDWPLPAIHVLYQLNPLVKAGFLHPDDRPPLAELYEHNPLLFDLVLKRSVRHPDTGQGFSAEVFVHREHLGF